MKSDAQLVELLRTEVEPFLSVVSQSRVQHLAMRQHTRDAHGAARVSPWQILTLRDAKILRDKLTKALEDSQRPQEPAESSF